MQEHLGEQARRWLRQTLTGAVGSVIERFKRRATAPEAPTEAGKDTVRKPGKTGKTGKNAAPLTPEEESARRLNAIVDYLENADHAANLSKRSVMYRIVTQEREYQQARFRDAKSRIDDARKLGLKAREVARLQDVMADARARYQQLYTMLKKVTGKLDLANESDDIAYVQPVSATATLGIDGVLLAPDHEEQPLWKVASFRMRQTTYWKLGASKVLDSQGRALGPVRRGDYVEVTSAHADLDLQVRLQPIPGSGSESVLVCFALRLGPAVVVGDGASGRITVNGKRLTLAPDEQAPLPGEGHVWASEQGLTFRSARGDTFVVTRPDGHLSGWNIRGEFPDRDQGDLRGAAILDAWTGDRPGYWIGRQATGPSPLKVQPVVMMACLDSWKVQPGENLLPGGR
ncbi:MAG: hypothetical protein VKP72_00070 [bacterium]|nr:hypothetical protein [bacterium]